MSIKKLFNDHWEFSLQGLESSYESITSSGTRWEPVEIPHDWLIFNTRDLYADGIGWYRRSFLFHNKEKKERHSLRFEGVYMDSTLYVNGKEAGQWKYGYSTFEFDLS